MELTKFGTAPQANEYFSRLMNNQINAWYNARGAISRSYDAPGAPHSLDGPPLEVPSDFVTFGK